MIVPVNNGEGDKWESNSCAGISLLGVTGKIYRRTVIYKVDEIAEHLISEEQGGFREIRFSFYGCL